ncbi:DUF6783 domain-containing protein [Enterocloster hominis (ex Hitch et al. 2024)]|uniref:DUF6783 domain-containing protein n=1 Tax=Enterocloster hominis (ex Hitch et al. 2024) TaxID=1917870 RepID=UPI002E35F465|nr:DUF6783 domain-containing protein [Lachnoclostridium pacaense]
MCQTETICPREGPNIHFRHLYAPLRGIFGPNSGYIARYAPFIWAKSPTKRDAQLTESNVRTLPNPILKP